MLRFLDAYYVQGYEVVLTDVGPSHSGQAAGIVAWIGINKVVNANESQIDMSHLQTVP